MEQWCGATMVTPTSTAGTSIGSKNRLIYVQIIWILMFHLFPDSMRTFSEWNWTTPATYPCGRASGPILTQFSNGKMVRKHHYACDKTFLTAPSFTQEKPISLKAKVSGSSTTST